MEIIKQYLPMHRRLKQDLGSIIDAISCYLVLAANDAISLKVSPSGNISIIILKSGNKQ